MNIVLIGMPGSGKTTIALKLQEQINMKVIDMDTYIENKYHKSINDLFLMGENYFRKCESDCCKEVAMMDNVVIATGGGVVENSLNMEVLKRNGKIIFIHRDIEKIIQDIQIENRPLLKNNKEEIYSIYNRRQNMYIKYADVMIDNHCTITDIVEKIIRYVNTI